MKKQERNGVSKEYFILSVIGHFVAKIWDFKVWGKRVFHKIGSCTQLLHCKFTLKSTLPKVEDFLDSGTSKSIVDGIIKEGPRFFQIQGWSHHQVSNIYFQICGWRPCQEFQVLPNWRPDFLKDPRNFQTCGWWPYQGPYFKSMKTFLKRAAFGE